MASAAILSGAASSVVTVTVMLAMPVSGTLYVAMNFSLGFGRHSSACTGRELGQAVLSVRKVEAEAALIAEASRPTCRRGVA